MLSIECHLQTLEYGSVLNIIAINGRYWLDE